MIRGWAAAGCVAVGLLGGCKGEETDTDRLLDTGWFTDTDTDTSVVCVDHVVSTAPAAGEDGFYWRDPIRVRTATPVAEAYAAALVDADGVPVPTETVWRADGFDLVPTAPLSPSSTYVLGVTDCAGPTSIPFATSDLGTPIVGGASALVDGTWAVDLRDATWEQPVGLGALLSLYFTSPVLVGVEFANDSTLDLIGAQGVRDEAGNVYQSSGEATWDYPLAGFDAQPWFATSAEQVGIPAAGVDVLVYEFALEGTFSADGERIGGGRVSGRGDTRNLGPALDLGDDPGSVCEAAAGFGATCVACPDGQEYCLDLVGTGVEGRRVPGLTVVPVEP